MPQDDPWALDEDQPPPIEVPLSALVAPSLPDAFSPGGRLSHHVPRRLLVPTVRGARFDPWNDEAKRRTSCGKFGAWKVSGRGDLRFNRGSCDCWTCPRCGRRRTDLIRVDLDRHLQGVDTVFLYSLHRLPDGLMPAVGSRLTAKVQKLGGQYAWLRLATWDGPSFVLISDVNFSLRRYGNQPALSANPAGRDEVLPFLSYLLWHGIIRRGSSTGWPLSDDRRRPNRATTPAQPASAGYVTLGRGRDHPEERIRNEARRVYQEWQTDPPSSLGPLPEWREGRDAPDVDETTNVRLFEEAWARLHPP